MKLEIEYLKRAEKFFSKNSQTLSKEESTKLIIKALRKIILNEEVNINLKSLKGNLNSYYRIRKGKVRILFEVVDEKVVIKAIVNDVDFRGEVY